MSILKTIKDVMFRRRRELGEQADGLRSAGKFIEAAIADARESEIRFAINTIKDYEAFFPGDDASSVQQEPAAAPDAPVEWRVAEKDLNGGIFVGLLGKTAYLSDIVAAGQKYIKLPDGTFLPRMGVSVPHWCRTARTDNPDPHTYSWDGHWYLVRGNYKIDIDELFNLLPKDDMV